MARVVSKTYEQAKELVQSVNCNAHPYHRLWSKTYRRAGYKTPGAFRLAARRGHPKAVIAAAREIARINRALAKAAEEVTEDAA